MTRAWRNEHYTADAVQYLEELDAFLKVRLPAARLQLHLASAAQPVAPATPMSMTDKSGSSSCPQHRISTCKTCVCNLEQRAPTERGLASLPRAAVFPW